MKPFIAGLAALLVSACGSEPYAGPPVDEFRTSAMIDLASAVKTKNSGVPADDYGRPLSYRGLDGKIPDFTADMHGGGVAGPDNFAGQWTVLKFWGSWCGDCVKDGPFVDRLTTVLAEEPGLQFLSIHSPASFERREEAMGKWGSLEAYFADKGLSYPVAIDQDASIREAFLIDWTPTYLLVGPDLTVHAFRTELSVSGDLESVDQIVSQIKAIQGGVSSTN